MDLSSVSAALGSIKTATEIAKYIKDSGLSLEKAETKLKLAELISALADAKLEVVGVRDSLAEAEERIRTLEKQFEIKSNLTWEEPYYWLSTPTSREGPYCQKCYDTDMKLVHLHGDEHGLFRCKACSNTFTTQAHREYLDAVARQINS